MNHVFEAYLGKEIPDDHPQELDCCCNCGYHLEDKSHPCTDKKSCLEHRGYICLMPVVMTRIMGKGTEAPFAHSGWGKHGMCEMHARGALQGLLLDQPSQRKQEEHPVESKKHEEGQQGGNDQTEQDPSPR